MKGWSLAVIVLALPGCVWGLRRWRRRDETVSSQWLRDRLRETSKVEYDGPRWRFPVNKILNEAGAFNRQKLRRRA